MGNPKRPFKACKACRQRRIRCDQQQPCQRCARNNSECVREHNPTQTKHQLRKERNDLQVQARASALVFRALATGKRCDQVMEALRRNESIEQIAQKLQDDSEEARDDCIEEDNKSQDSSRASSWRDEAALGTILGLPSPLASPLDTATLHTASHQSHGTSATSSSQTQSEARAVPTDSLSLCGSVSKVSMDFNAVVSDLDASEEPLTAMPTASCRESLHSLETAQYPISPGGNTTRFPSPTSPEAEQVSLMTLPPRLVVDLTDAVFAWQVLPFPFMSRNLFIRDFLVGRTDHCSPALVRAISCLGCRALGGYDTYQSTYANMGNRLFEEARLLLAQGSKAASSLPDAQALSLLATHQLSIGDYQESRQLADEAVIRVTRLIGDERRPSAEGFHPCTPSTQSTALLSAVTLSRFVRIVTSCLVGEDSKDSKEEADTQLDELLNLPSLMQANSTLRDEHRRSFLICQLTDAIYRFENERYKVDVPGAINILEKKYQECLLWYKAAMEGASAQDKHCPFLHLFYHFSLLVLFRPFCYTESVCGVSPTVICSESSAAIMSLERLMDSLGSKPLNQLLAKTFVLAASNLDEDVYESIEPGIAADGEEVGGASLKMSQFTGATHSQGLQSV